MDRTAHFIYPAVMHTLCNGNFDVLTFARFGRKLWFILAAAAVSASLQAEPIRIGRIIVRTGGVYSRTEASHGFVYRLADQLHVKTRASVVRSFLLFREGDVYDPARLAESERNLRSLGFLKSVSISAGQPHEGVVDVSVDTEDAWSIEPGTDAGSSGGVATYGISFKDANLAGFGQQLAVSFKRGTQRSRAAIDFNDPSFFAPYRRAHLMFAKNSDGFEHGLLIGRPFYSFSAPRSTELSFEDVKRTNRWFASGFDLFRYQQRHRQFVAAIGRAIDPNEGQANRWTAGIRLVSDGFGELPRYASARLPVNRSFRYSFVRFEHVENDFITRRFIDEDQRDQDFNLGLDWSAEAAVSPRVFGVDRTTEFAAAAASRGLELGDGSFLIGGASFQTRLDRGVKNGILSGSVRYVHQFESRVPQTFVARVLFDNGWNLDRDVQFFADGSTGLRGYRLYAFEGSRNLILNFEQRIFLGRELLQIVSPGVVAFADIGRATNRSLLFPSEFKSDVGVGIRFGLPRTPRNTLRLDFAYPLQRDPSGRRGLLVSFSSGQAF